MTFLLVAVGSFLGTLLGNLSLFYLIGKISQGQERKKLAELQRLQQGYIDMVEKERVRLERYAQMEG